MKTRIISLLFVAAVGLTACDDLLDVDTVSSISAGNYWETESDVKGYMNGVYNSYRSLTNSVRYGEERSDSFKPGLTNIASTSIWPNVISPSDGFSWRSLYSLIHHANLLIKYTPPIAFRSDTEKNDLLAQAYWMRARAYLILIQTWGDVPVVVNPSETDKDPLGPRIAATDVMTDVILNDINTALSLFPSESISNRNRASKAAAYCLKADALAWKYSVLGGTAQDLTDGIAAVDQVDKASIATLLPKDDYQKIFASNNKKNNEIIFSLYLKNLEYTAMYIRLVTPDAQVIPTVINKDEIPHGTNLSARDEYAPSVEVQNALKKYAGDVRFAASVVYGYSDAARTTIAVTSQNKYKGTIIDQQRVYDDDIIVYRLADMLLLKAEMQANLGGANVANAITTLNRVRDRAGLAAYSGATDQASVQTEILDERFRELCFELKRWPDLLRAHNLGVIDIYQKVPQLVGKTTPLYLPITVEMMSLNPLLEQTPGYN